MTGAVASERVTEATKGSLRLDGNQPQSVMAEGSLTARLTGRAGAKAGHSDPAIPNGRVVAQECNGRRELDCETDGSSRCESRA